MGDFLKLKKSNCQNCYKCIRHCPVKSIKFNSNQAQIVTDECILCGQCFVVCPQNAKEIRNDTHIAKDLISNNDVIVSIAPSFVANFEGATIDTIRTALQKLGFADVQETAIGATIVKTEYERMIREKSQSVIISSCCPTINSLIQKYYPEAIPFIAPILTPMQAHAKLIKIEQPDAKVVFVGPCLSKKKEGEEVDTNVDCVLTFEELDQWLIDEGIEIEAGVDNNKKTKARSFPTTSGILKTFIENSDEYDYIAADGIDNCTAIINDLINNNIQNCFIEMSACVGSCVGGPVMSKNNNNRIKNTIAVNKSVGKEDFAIEENVNINKEYNYLSVNRRMPGQSEIDAVLKKMGKINPEFELNCSACGYNTCREKAIAICQGKAEITMCLPFLKDKAESFSDKIITNSPNGIIVLNEDLEIQQINKGASKIFGFKNQSDLIGEPVLRLLDPKPFIDVMETGMGQREEKCYLADYDKYVEQSIVYDRSYRMLLCIIRDITVEEYSKIKKEEQNKKTVEVTNRVIEKQMRVVQEIASLLGETTAETKIVLTKLKDSFNDE